MKIGIDGSTVTNNKAGVGYYTFSMIKALEQVDSKNEYFVFTNNSENFLDLELKENFHIVEIKANRAGFAWILQVIKRLNKEKFDVFFSTSNFSFAIFYNKTVQVIHDLAPVKYPGFFTLKGSLMYRLQLNSCLKRAKVIFTTTETIKNEIVEYSPETKDKVYVGGYGVHEWVFKESSELEQNNTKAKYTLPENYFLSVSTLEPRKNHINMILGFNEFFKENSDYHYVIVGKKGWFYQKIFETAKSVDAYGNIHFLGYVPEEDLGAIYDLSKGVVMLSFYEGIGLSTQEGMIRGLPILASDIPVFHEVLGENAIFCNLVKKDLIKKGFNELKERNKSNFITNSRYNWNSAAQKLLEIL